MINTKQMWRKQERRSPQILGLDGFIDPDWGREWDRMRSCHVQQRDTLKCLWGQKLGAAHKASVLES